MDDFALPDFNQFPFREPRIEDATTYSINKMMSTRSFSWADTGMYEKTWEDHEAQRQEVYKKFPTSYFPHKDPNRRETVSPYRKKGKSGSAPVIALVPVEIWMEIAKWTCVLDDQEEVPLGHFRGAFQLSRVSGGLRTLARSMPELWSTISIVPNRYGRLPKVECVRFWLRRSGTCPLDILLRENNKTRRPPAGLWPVLEELSQHVDRWRTAVLWVPWASELNWNACKRPRMLQHLTLQGYTDHTKLGSIGPLVKKIPSLESMIWEDHFGAETRYSGGFMASLPIKFGYLTRLKLENPILVVEVLTIFSRSPTLLDVSLENVGTDGRSFQPPSNLICLPQLHSLKLVVDFEAFEGRGSVPILPPLLSCFYAPALRNVHFGYEDRWSHSTFEYFSRNSNCRLTSCIFDIIALQERDLDATLKLLSYMGTLQTFALRTSMDQESALTDAVADALAPGPWFYLPTLRTISVNMDTLGPAKFAGCFSKMVQQRCCNTPRFLREVNLVGVQSRDLAHPDIRRLAALAKAGILEVTYDE